LIADFGVVYIADMIGAGKTTADTLTILVIVMACAVIFTLVLYQFWAQNEYDKIRRMEKHFSSLFRKVRAVKNRTESLVHRYTLWSFMAGSVGMGAYVACLALGEMAARV
ncbi:MAG: hypothetical protein HQL36_10195, partial [Alphaproteobacteria bacterium]|nr:hypothetical protein [Alphaproteobacteria bacterium]